jgi:hypothetical protein
VLFLYGLVITCVRVALTHCPMVPFPWSILAQNFACTDSSGDNPNYLSITQLHLPPEDAEAELVNGNASWIQIESNKVYSSLLR